jgi:hypothetical protein
MAYEYRLPPIDIDGAIKAVQDNAFRQEQLRLKYEESMNKAIDDQQKLYNGKVRDQDVAEFNGKFAAYAEAQKAYQALNRRGGRGGDLTASKLFADRAKNDMLSYVDESTSLGSMQIGLGKMFKDPTKVLNTNKYTEVYSDLSTLNVGRLKEKYNGDLNKIPKDFEFKQEDFSNDDMKDLADVIKRYLPINAQSSFSRPIPSIDPTTGKQKMSKQSINFEGKSMTVDVPMDIIKSGIDPITTLNAVISASKNQKNADYMKVLKRDLYKSAEDPSNPQVQKEAQDRIKRTMDIFGINDKTNITEQHLFASTFVDQARMGDIEVENWSKLDDIASMFTKANGLKLKDLQMQKLKNDINESKSPSGMKILNQLLTVYSKAVATGLTNVDQWATQFENMFKALGYPMDKATILKAAEGQFRQQQEIINSIFEFGRVDAGGKK